MPSEWWNKIHETRNPLPPEEQFSPASCTPEEADTAHAEVMKAIAAEFSGCGKAIRGEPCEAVPCCRAPEDRILRDIAKMDEIQKGRNPKDIVGSKKSPLRFVPPALSIAVAPVMASGAAKYGAYNWRDYKITATTYVEAAMRHLLAWSDGEDRADDSGLSHLAHAAACLGIMLDAQACGSMIDDRFPTGPAAQMLADQDKSEEGGERI